MNETLERQTIPITRATVTDSEGWLRDALLHWMKADLAAAERYAIDRTAVASMEVSGHFFD